ncbi:hypothetical protein CDIK_1456 [Cucumispora dikerogammari]|nr:hypothetical protein CDIK_1456 [Cucumispora dikerogammari]
MKPHTLSLLKCADCTYTSPLQLKITKSSKLTYEPKDVLLIKDVDFAALEYFNEKNIQNFQSTDLYIYKGDVNDITNIYETMLCNYIEEGELMCTCCSRKYNIENGIVDFITK